MERVFDRELSDLELTQLEKFNPEGMKWIYHSNYYDGPLSGMVEYRGLRYWINCYDQDANVDGVWYRRFTVWTLSPESEKWEKERHSKFRELVGPHCDYEDFQEPWFNEKKYPHWKTYYDLYPPKPCPLTGTLVGWAEW